MMAVYLIADVEANDFARLAPYRAVVADTVAKYGGRFIIRGGATKLLDGGPEPKTIAAVESPDAAALDSWHNSPEYQKIPPFRLESCTGRVFRVEGVSG
jgi:uncharacterized protein (DUF1330 family)